MRPKLRFINAITVLTLMFGSSVSQAESNIRGIWTIYIKASTANSDLDLKRAFAKIEIDRSAVVGGTTCRFTSHISTRYPKQRPDELAMVLVDFSGNCREYNQRLLQAWLHDPTFRVIQTIGYPSVTGSN